MTLTAIPDSIISSDRELIVNVPMPVNEQTNGDAKWVFQRLADKLQEVEFRVSLCVNTNRLLLTFTYALLFVASIGRMIFEGWMLRSYYNVLIANNKRIVLIDAFLSFIWLVYFLIIFIMKFRMTYTDNTCRTVLVFVTFCIQYFTLSFLAAEVIYSVAKTWEWAANVVLLVIYGLLADKSPVALVLVMYFLFMFFLIESLVRLLICKCTNPWGEEEERRLVIKRIPIEPFINSKHGQKNCAICLREFEGNDKVCQLECHPNHIFHSDCTKEWLSRNHQCPYCRASI
eukprot:TRINITY_DN7497_c0_g2_i3.p1 TRINITY_DN7497_c0_g2~~TRINITY_DN7497_c0_g2_i3.p1  ORF type:complete len:287 (+),score=16.45 TRINITY_DN7497_c0_g2_i3:183-1043(+)